jgi:isoleucyl-tRNA synthetase
MPTYAKLRDTLALESEILRFWEQAAIADKVLRRNERNRAHKRFVFYEGPPTANDKPHFGHLIPRVYKDLFPRYKLMQGYHVIKKGGWDTHGLPVELKVERELGLNSKREIEAFGVENFVKKCKENVWKFKGEWERFDPRMGFWYDQRNAYITYTNEYIESVWWALKKIWEKGLLYKGHKVLPYCPRCGTPLELPRSRAGLRDRQRSIYILQAPGPDFVWTVHLAAKRQDERSRRSLVSRLDDDAVDRAQQRRPGGSSHP